MPNYRGLMTELPADQMREFADALSRILLVLGPLPLDYEVHQGEGLPLHAHINARLYPYSNVAGTLNLPSTLLQSAAAIRNAMRRHSGVEVRVVAPKRSGIESRARERAI